MNEKSLPGEEIFNPQLGRLNVWGIGAGSGPKLPECLSGRARGNARAALRQVCRVEATGLTSKLTITQWRAEKSRISWPGPEVYLSAWRRKEAALYLGRPLYFEERNVVTLNG